MNYEQMFKERYPYARHTTEHIVAGLNRFTVFAGDYICAEATSKQAAYRLAYEYEREGLITPDPAEQTVAA